jgi:hypothetical protein
VLALARAERSWFDPLSVRSLSHCWVRAGALDPAVSFAWLWASLEREIGQYGHWEAHFATLRSPLAELIASKLRDAAVTVPEDD